MKTIPTDAATVMLLRDCADAVGRGFEVLLVRRNRKSSFVPGYHVFPGGVIDPGDFEPGVERFVRGMNRDAASSILPDMSRPDKALGAWVGAIRETFEEVGILLAQTKDGAPVALRSEDERHKFCHYRKMLLENKISFSRILEAEELFLPLDRLHYFSHWITPEGFPLRYDVRFFVAWAPADQTVLHDGVELTNHVWLTPGDALKQYEQGKLDMVLPQIMTLQDMTQFKTIPEAIDAARKRHVPATLTKIERIGGKDVEVMPDGSVFENRPPTYSWPDEEEE